MRSLTVIVVSRGLSALLRCCLETLLASLRDAGRLNEARICVVDNATPFPYQRAEFPEGPIEILRLDTHRSFAFCCNWAAHHSPSKLILLLNNDVLLSRSQVGSLLRGMEKPQAATIGARLLFPDGTIQHCGVVFGAGAVGPYHLHRRQPAHTLSRSACEYQAVTGACMLVDGEVFRSLQGLDESYPFGLEDIDFCLRVRQSGRRIYCMNDTESLHFESMTEGRVGLDIPSRRLFMDRWAGKYAIDG
jgi:GT2 family glycosyltransferase